MKIVSGNGQLNIGSLKKGLVLDLDISSEGLQGTTKFKDKTPYENNGTLSNITLTTDRKGKANSAGLFNGTDSYINCGNNSSLDITGAITMSAWIKASDTTSFQTLFGKGISFGGNKGYSLGIYNTKIYFDTHDSVQRDALQSLSGTVKQNEWFFLTATWDGTTTTNGKKIYINGVLNSQGTSTISEIVGTSNYSFSITKDPYFFMGSIERPQIWNRALSADEVKLLFSSYNPCLMIVKGGIG